MRGLCRATAFSAVIRAEPSSWDTCPPSHPEPADMRADHGAFDCADDNSYSICLDPPPGGPAEPIALRDQAAYGSNSWLPDTD